jgi:hypothetical protein
MQSLVSSVKSVVTGRDIDVTVFPWRGAAVDACSLRLDQFLLLKLEAVDLSNNLVANETD